ncbi:MAG: hypothetical protein ABGX47_00580 [Martelella sp.]|uniref:hypothetical protein n=1 Tax=Martelella sp. TaxID=1969699 RepID=UPI00324297BC
MNDDVRDISLFSNDALPVSVQGQFVNEWQRVETTLRTLESYQGILFVPAYMGLRNSGRHFVGALSNLKSGDRAGAESSLGKAVEELRRARHDARRSLINYCHFKLLLIEENFSTERVYQVCPAYFDIRDKIEEVNTRLNEDFSDSEAADAFFIDLENNYLPNLIEVFERMVRAKSAALDGIKEKDEREDFYKKLAVAGFGVGLVGVILAVVAFFV